MSKMFRLRGDKNGKAVFKLKKRSRSLICCDSMHLLKHCIIPDDAVPRFDCLIADPPDNIRNNYDNYCDSVPYLQYRAFLGDLIRIAYEQANTSWISFNAKHMFTVGALVDTLLPPEAETRIFIQHFTFGQHRQTDCGNGYRPMLRIRHLDAPIFPNNIRVKSWRQENGDKRASPAGKVPLDVWDFPRVTGNSSQRRPWHPTQLHEGLVRRMVDLSATSLGTVLDPFAGTGTTFRACRSHNVTGMDISPTYCRKMYRDPATWLSGYDELQPGEYLKWH